MLTPFVCKNVQHKEYQWVATNGDARLRAMALQGMQRADSFERLVRSYH